MSAAPGRRIMLGPTAVSIHDFPLLAPGAEAELRAFLSRAFALREVGGVDLDRARGLGRIRHAAVADPARLWHRLGRLLRGDDDTAGGIAAGDIHADTLFLAAPGPLRVIRVGGTLSTLRVRVDAPDRVRVGHPLLRRLPGMAWRLEEEVAALPGVRDFRPSPLTAELAVRLEPGPHAAERLVRALEESWPRLLSTRNGRPSAPRLAAATGLLALATVGTLAVPELLPVAAAGILLQGAPNFIVALRDLRHGRIGLAALHATGLAFFLVTRRPLSSTIVGVLTQLWPVLARDRAIASQRRLLAPWRRRPRWAWLVLEDGSEVEVPVERLVPGDRIRVRRGDTVPADGTLDRGLVAALAPLPLGAAPADKEPGDALRAGERILDGTAVLRVDVPAGHSMAALVEAALPHGLFDRLPALDEAERVANRNARPALALALYTLAARRQLRPAQGIIRPDYATGPRLGAQLAAQAAFAEALRDGVLFRHPSALHPLARTRIFVLDDSAPLETRTLEIGRVVTTGARDTEILALAAPVFGPVFGPVPGGHAPAPAAGPIQRQAGAAWYRDAAGDRIDVASAAALAAAGRPDLAASPARTGVRRSVWVLRNGTPLGRIDFRDGAPRPARAAIDALRALPGPAIRVILLSGGAKATAARLGAALGAEAAIGGLTPDEKAQVIRGLGQRAAWIGDGTAAACAPAIAASGVSLSTAAPSEAETADALLLAGLDGLAAARAAARRQRAAIAADYRLVYAANLTGVAGALTAGFGGLNSGLASNTGTAAILARHARRLRALEVEKDRLIRAALEGYLP